MLLVRYCESTSDKYANLSAIAGVFWYIQVTQVFHKDFLAFYQLYLIKHVLYVTSIQIYICCFASSVHFIMANNILSTCIWYSA